MAPEVLLNAGHSYSVDFYTLGALLYELMTGLPPYYAPNPAQILQNMLVKTEEGRRRAEEGRKRREEEGMRREEEDGRKEEESEGRREEDGEKIEENGRREEDEGEEKRRKKEGRREEEDRREEEKRMEEEGWFENGLKKPKGVSKEMLEILERLLSQNPDGRIKDFKSLKGMAWFEGVDWKGIREKRVSAPLGFNLYVSNLHEEFGREEGGGGKEVEQEEGVFNEYPEFSYLCEGWEGYFEKMMGGGKREGSVPGNMRKGVVYSHKKQATEDMAKTGGKSCFSTPKTPQIMGKSFTNMKTRPFLKQSTAGKTEEGGGVGRREGGLGKQEEGGGRKEGGLGRKVLGGGRKEGGKMLQEGGGRMEEGRGTKEEGEGRKEEGEGRREEGRREEGGRKFKVFLKEKSQTFRMASGSKENKPLNGKEIRVEKVDISSPKRVLGEMNKANKIGVFTDFKKKNVENAKLKTICLIKKKI